MTVSPITPLLYLSQLNYPVKFLLFPSISFLFLPSQKKDIRIRTTGWRNKDGSYTLRKNITYCVGTASGLVNPGKSSPLSSPKLRLLRMVFLTGKRPESYLYMRIVMCIRRGYLRMLYSLDNSRASNQY